VDSSGSYGVWDRLQINPRTLPGSPTGRQGSARKVRTGSFGSHNSQEALGQREEEPVGEIFFRSIKAVSIGSAAQHRLNVVTAINRMVQERPLASFFPCPETVRKAKLSESFRNSAETQSSVSNETEGGGPNYVSDREPSGLDEPNSERALERQIELLLQSSGKHVLHPDLAEIVRKGDIDDVIIHIISGHAEEISEDNQLLRNIEPGDLLGIESLLSVGKLGCGATVIARGSVNVRVYTGIAQKFRERHDLAPIVWRNIVKMLAIRNARDLLSLTAWQPRTEVDHENQA